MLPVSEVGRTDSGCREGTLGDGVLAKDPDPRPKLAHRCPRAPRGAEGGLQLAAHEALRTPAQRP